MLKVKVAEDIVRRHGTNTRFRFKVIGLGNTLFWWFIGVVMGYFTAAVVAATVWYR